MTLERQDLSTALRRRGWIIVFVMIIATMLAFASTTRQQSRYSAVALLLVSPAVADSDAMLTAQQIGDTYRVLITSHTFLTSVANRLGTIDVETLEENLSTTSSKPAQFIEIHYIATDPEQAALVANTVALTFDLYVEDRGTNLLIDALATMRIQREALVAELAALDPAAPEQTASPIAPLATPQNVILDQQRATLLAAIDRLDESIASVQGESALAYASVDVVDTADPPDEPAEPSASTAAVLGLAGGFIGGLLIFAIVVFLEGAQMPPRETE